MARADNCARAVSWRADMDKVFESGTSSTWRGFYVHAPGTRRHAMHLDLAFSVGVVAGGGSDDIGRFAIRGGYDQEGVRVWWHKHYVGAHSVWYDGVRDGAASRVLYGGWSIGTEFSGGFRIWRGAQAADAGVVETAAEVSAVELLEELAGVGVR